MVPPNTLENKNADIRQFGVPPMFPGRKRLPNGRPAILMNDSSILWLAGRKCKCGK